MSHQTHDSIFAEDGSVSATAIRHSLSVGVAALKSAWFPLSDGDTVDAEIRADYEEGLARLEGILAAIDRHVNGRSPDGRGI